MKRNHVFLSSADLHMYCLNSGQRLKLTDHVLGRHRHRDVDLRSLPVLADDNLHLLTPSIQILERIHSCHLRLATFMLR